MDRAGPQINHLSFADDSIIFTTGRRNTLKLVMQTLAFYEVTSGQMISKNKSHFVLPDHVFPSTILRIKDLTGIKQTHNPITYLGCPIYIIRQKISYYNGLVCSVASKIAGWHSKLLSYRGRYVLIKYVLYSMPLHILSTYISPKSTLK